jgi:hypothetical protein
MLLDTNQTVRLGLLLQYARELKSEHGENEEYDRALVELCLDAAGLTQDDKPEMAAILGIVNPGFIPVNLRVNRPKLYVRCLDDSNEDHLSEGKVYQVVDQDESIPPGRTDLFVLNDAGEKERYIEERFCPLKQEEAEEWLINQAAELQFPEEVLRLRKTSDGYELLVGPQGEYCYAVEPLENGGYDFERR